MYKVEVINIGAKKYSSKYPFSFSIYSNGKYAEFYCKSKAQLMNWLSALRKVCIMSNFHDEYKVQELLGSGGYGKVIDSNIQRNNYIGLRSRIHINRHEICRKIHQV